MQLQDVESTQNQPGRFSTHRSPIQKEPGGHSQLPFIIYLPPPQDSVSHLSLHDPNTLKKKMEIKKI